jgi:hypothetical protein
MDTILWYILTFIGGIATGVLGNYFASYLTDIRNKKQIEKQKKRTFSFVYEEMRDLIDEMRNDLLKDDFRHTRSFIILANREIAFNCAIKRFFYYENEHDNLVGKLSMLENYGFIENISDGNTKKYQMKEEFVAKIKSISPRITRGYK